MSRRHHYRRKDKEPPDLDITTFLNLMVVLIPFLLISAVFSRITILELNVPTGGSGVVDDTEKVVIEVIVREQGLEIGNGKGVVASIPKIDDSYDYAKLSEYLLSIKQNYPDKTDATILMEPDLEYENLVNTMDVVRGTAITPEMRDRVALDGPEDDRPEENSPGEISSEENTEEIKLIGLFPDISIGDAP